MSATNKPTVEEIRCWNRGQLLDWIQQNLIEPLDDEDKELFLKAKINGKVFLNHAGDERFFRKRCKLPPGISDSLASLASKVIGTKSKSCRLHYTHHADSQLTTSQETANKAGARSPPTELLKERL